MYNTQCNVAREHITKSLHEDITKLDAIVTEFYGYLEYNGNDDCEVKRIEKKKTSIAHEALKHREMK